jgi:hypothetical protein
VYHAVNIVRMVSALQKTLTRHIHVPTARQQFSSRLGVAGRDPHKLLKKLVVLNGV